MCQFLSNFCFIIDCCRMYGKFMSYRSYIRKAISQVFFRYIYETGRYATSLMSVLMLLRQNKMSDIYEQIQAGNEMVISTVLKPVFVLCV